MIRVFLVDDHNVLRAGLRSLLAGQPDLTVVGEAGDGLALLEQLATTPADVVLLDVKMPGLNGADTLRRLREEYSAVRVLVLSMLTAQDCLIQMLDAGALGYVLKHSGLNEVVHGIRMVASGQHFLCTEAGFAALHHLREKTASATTAAKTNALSKRETEILRLIAEGFTNQEISDKLFISRRTIETHRQNIISKTKMKNTASLIRFAVSEGLVS